MFLTPKWSFSLLLPLARGIATVMASLLAMRRTKQPSLKCYFLSEAVVNGVCEALILTRQPYALAYLVLRPFNFATMLWVAPPTIPACLTALILAWATFLSIPGKLSFYAAASLIQGVLYVVAGASAVRLQPILAILWMVLGIFNLGFATRMGVPVWA